VAISDARRDIVSNLPTDSLALLPVRLFSFRFAIGAWANPVFKNTRLRQQVAVLKKENPRPQSRWSDRLFWIFRGVLAPVSLAAHERKTRRHIQNLKLQTLREPKKMISPPRHKGTKKSVLFVSWCLCGSLF
jgi:hypothetical protein